MFVRWKRRERKGRFKFEAGEGALLIAYATKARREGGKSKQDCTYIAGIRESDTIGGFPAWLARETRWCEDDKRRDEVHERATIWHLRRRLKFWCNASWPLKDYDETTREALSAGLQRRVLRPTLEDAKWLLSVRWSMGMPPDIVRMLEHLRLAPAEAEHL